MAKTIIDGVKKTLRCRTVAQGGLRQSNYIRDLPMQTVADVNLDGDGDAPNGLEALLAAFGSCLTAGIHANALSRQIELRHLEVNLEGDMYATAHWGTNDKRPNPIGFQSIRASVSIDANLPLSDLDALVKHTMLWSPVANTLFNPVELNVTVVESAGT